jgi:hypothetical protein
MEAERGLWNIGYFGLFCVDAADLQEDFGVQSN